MKKVISLVATAVVTLGISNSVHAKSVYNINRLYGDDRYKTSISISNSFSNGKLKNIIIASGRDFPDALAGSVLSKKLNAPIILASDSIEESLDCIQYIKDHLDKDGTIYLLGGAASISNELVDYVKQQGYTSFVRLGGQDRFDTNKYIVNSMNVQKGTPIVIVNAYGFADALSASSVAALNGYPIIMTSNSALTDEAKDMIKNIEPKEVYIIGGYASVGYNVKNQIRELVPSLESDNLISLAGDDRYETSLSICKYFNVNSDTAVIANGENFPDALSGSALAAKLNAPIVLTDGSDITKQKEFIDKSNFKNIILLGGPSSIDFSIEYELKDPSTITQEEKDYINKLLDYCYSFNTENVKAESYFHDTMNKFTSEDIVAEFENPNTMMDALEKFIELFKDCKSYLQTYEKNLTSLRDEVSKIESPKTLEGGKQLYLNSINSDIQSVNKVINLTGSYIDTFVTFKDAVDSAEESKLDAALKDLEDINKNKIENVEDLRDGNNGIDNLREKLLKIKSNIK
ncbi:cell wall-binding repeat-containing protein [Clostridium thailandense]|uniref:cell wall-binding repeat-containing protein n=1 Tax=Clostridium thailandense TaxID=2794346 RepID=UPI00398A47B7